MPPKSEQINPFTSLGINELLSRGIQEILPSREALKKELESGKKLTVYLGVDPTAPYLHLGHSITLLVLKRFQKLGHKTVFLVGDFTARIGDPSGKTTQRKPLSKKEVFQNAKTYRDQLERILKPQMDFNSRWLGRLRLGKILEIASGLTVQKMLARDMFRERVKKELPIGLHEFLYPIMQGYDSVALKTDIEIGGSDQLFNMLVGRDLVRRYLGKEKFVVTTRLLVDPSSGAKMSKSEGNLVALNDTANDMYAKVMAFPDELVRDLFELCTEVPMEEAEEIIKLPPRDAKAKLAHTITAMYHGEGATKKAEKEFDKTFVLHRPPADIPVGLMMGGATSTTRVLLETGLSSSKREARQLEEQGGVHVQGPGSDDWEVAGDTINVQDGTIIRVGKRRFIKLEIRN